ncbi:hypothetical protein SARC_05716 [Sphaeroforma arctica JP610]|uniref:CP-type G domain-containing protein n=1 Tax=Sphaeroforma arctica JP610 TaxID=667725 RepID=A0A0L0FYR2_9EUKA|nr:hypothetical protein SARC_05716 [Sphaeroforma arctica JP610]KNC81987.1 hypothetical protein SARC_05716 [Sphaeroforma arctica JP610]|eukprot:XP_014155889.1 hypothetical protein SARC_05716 [Sphaeroforma arctica JP610]
MVKKTGTKRLTMKMKFKIERKCRDHKKKQRREERNNPSKKPKKDPGIPNLWPFKEDLLRKIEAGKERQEELRAKNKARQQVERAKEVAKMRKERSLAQMVKTAEKRGDEYDMELASAKDEKLANFTDSSKRAYYKEFKKVVDHADVILQVLDARDPMGCRCKQVEEMIEAQGSDKKVVLVLNKIDLVPKDVVAQWLKYLRNYFPTIAFKASTQDQANNLGSTRATFENASADQVNAKEALGTDTLVKLLKNYARSVNMKKSISVGIVGYPNVGKSSIINSLKRSRTCAAGATAGVTKVMQEIQLDKNIKLIDSPGIVFSSTLDGDVLLRNVINVDTLADITEPVDMILSRCNKEQVMEMYQLPEYTDTQDFLVQFANKRGKLKKGGVPNIHAAAKSLLKDWNTGAIPFYTLPPVTEHMKHAGETTTIVTGFSQAFDMAALEKEEEENVLSGLSSEKKTYMTLAPGEQGDMEMDDSDSDDEAVADADVEVTEVVAMEDDQVVAPFDLTKAHMAAHEKKVKGKQSERMTEALDEESRALNPTANRDLKKAAKNAKKERLRQVKAQALLMDANLGGGDDAYSFASDYVEQSADGDINM